MKTVQANKLYGKLTPHEQAALVFEAVRLTCKSRDEWTQYYIELFTVAAEVGVGK